MYDEAIKHIFKLIEKSDVAAELVDLTSALVTLVNAKVTDKEAMSVET